jgi:hypothetical protein
LGIDRGERAADVVVDRALDGVARRCELTVDVNAGAAAKRRGHALVGGQELAPVHRIRAPRGERPGRDVDDLALVAHRPDRTVLATLATEPAPIATALPAVACAPCPSAVAPVALALLA